MGKQEALKQFTVDLTEQARKGEIDPIVGRDEEIRQIVDILMRRRQNNPILTGEAGVGKTAVVEGFALRIARGDVPPPLKDVTLRVARHRPAAGRRQHEGRVREAPAPGDRRGAGHRPKPIILFIDEAHTLIGAGGAAGTGDAANLLKPALARGTLRTIAATTWAEYKKHIEKDPALTRRFQVVQVDEPERGEGDPDDARRGVACSRSITACRCSTRRSRRRCGCRTATSRRASCPTRRSACSTPPAPAWPSASTRCRPRSRTAGGASRRSRPSRASSAAKRRSASTSASAARDVDEKLGDRARAPGRAARRAGARRRSSSTRSSTCARSCAAATSRSTAPAASRGRRGRAGRPAADDDAADRTRDALLAELRELQDKLADAAGRGAADPADASTSRPSPAWSPTGPASRSAAW